MGRKRAPEHDWVCRGCRCPCEPPGVPPARHVGGGQGMKACAGPALPVLRSDLDAELAAEMGLLRERWGPQNPT